MEDAKESLKGGRDAWLLGLGIWLAPLAWGADHIISYSLVQHSCSTGHFYVLHVITVISALVALLGFVLAAGQYRRMPPGANDEGGSAFDRGHFMALLGMVSSLGFFIVILADGVPRWILSPCS